MSRGLEWRKRWVVAEGDEPLGYVSSLPQQENKENLLNAGNDSASVSTAVSGFGKGARRMSSSTMASSHVDMDDDNLSSVSFSSHGRDSREFLPPAATVGTSSQSSLVIRQHTDTIFCELLDWLSDVTGSLFLSQDKSSSSSKLYKLLDSGDILYALLSRSRLLCTSKQQAPPTDPKEKVAYNFEMFTKTCIELGIPSHSIIEQGDRDSRRIISCLVLFSRCCRANNNREIRALSVDTRALSKIGLRPDEMTLAKSMPAVQEMQLKGTFWVPDSFSQSCMLCERAFGFWNRRHHCRSCGGLFDSACASNRARCLGYQSKQRICATCFQQRQVSNK
mmetsp:Transcript_17440/g.28156  ORF Transcript_17440/g.28156 Transcript_17440/m.28156 type:complete len:335 (+) Transcript_17440:29-1033(+)